MQKDEAAHLCVQKIASAYRRQRSIQQCFSVCTQKWSHLQNTDRAENRIYLPLRNTICA